MRNIAIVTITETRLQRCKYQWSLKVGKKESWGDVCGNSPESAAAMAVNLAILHNQGCGYTILGPRDVLDCIPNDIRNYRNNYDENTA